MTYHESDSRESAAGQGQPQNEPVEAIIQNSKNAFTNPNSTENTEETLMKKQKKKSRKKKVQRRNMTPEEAFLQELGLVPRNFYDVFTEELVQEIEQAGEHSEELDGAGSLRVSAFNGFYATENVAKQLLCTQYHRLLGLLEDLSEIRGNLTNATRVADLGNGTGIAAMYLAKNHPECKFEVYGFAANPLRWGRKWAQEQGLNNIEFVECSYEELAEGPSEENHDLVICSYALGLEPSSSDDEEVFLYGDAEPQPTKETQDAITAMSKLLSEDGVGVIAISASQEGFTDLCQALRNVNLGIDYLNSVFWGESQEHDPRKITCTLVVRKGIPQICGGSKEDGRALIAIDACSSKLQKVMPGTLELYSEFFGGGEVLLVTEWVDTDGCVERVRLLQRGGLLLIEHTTTQGFREGSLHSSAAIMECVNLINECKQEREQSGGVRVRRYDVAPTLKELIDYYDRTGCLERLALNVRSG